MGSSVAVIGAGSWGTALALVLADNGCKVTMWARRQEVVDEILAERTNSRYLPDVTLPETISPTSDLERALADHDYVLAAMPSVAFRDTMKQVSPFIHKDTRVIHATKGFDKEKLNRMSQVILEEIPQLDARNLAVLTGPSHAEEVSRRFPTTVVVASKSRATAEAFQDLFMNTYFRVYTNPDVVGAELGGALKNIIALGVGLSDGLQFGDNAKAALMTRGLTEISRLGIQMGAAQMTFAGLAGIGDLIVTCTSKHSRNWRAGYQLGQGKTVDEVLSSMNMVVEGIHATKAAYALSQKHEVIMPITNAIFHVLFEGKNPRAAVEDLMGRGKTHEMEEVARMSMRWEE
ncbi:NAD(P)H-dependent glycerol-3-phosphate dehydrogenase [Effusibacillus lacus]|uniref:Glycerol-3-phosphate dehydrogenase [NAD(P)+] n=1 Tax=Effusibacillus lacus TaxID=1348429 RepID=A0A292YLC6_9BACL|nr:NAD(P)H-dependent glycerol-3-phosphate dehydrogenase [Effusibacillus lacus]TCS75271.1 glycerol 3-phosphate dehydrogenase (NAD(P)+) [Effusibacillus lacus]GAX89709.1 glycerol-3-phosphate dehydrogenase [Effusibacillus lacus]